MIPETNFHITTTPPKEYTTTHESGMKLTVHFCENCGGTIYKKADRKEFQGFIILLAGTLDNLDERKTAKPQQELYIKHRAAWLSALDNTVQKEEF